MRWMLLPVLCALTPPAAGSPRFVDVTEQVGLAFTGTIGRAFPALVVQPELLMQQNMGNGVAVGDYDRDGDLDVYLLGQAGVANRLYRNERRAGRSRFRDVTPDSMGDLDLYATNITDPAGVFGVGAGNVLYRNQFAESGAHRFVDQAALQGVLDTYWGWGTVFVDLENDGDLDLVAVTGFDAFVGQIGGQDHPLHATPSVVLRNDGTGRFSRETGSGLERPDDSRALVAFDYDRDGDQDLLVTNVDQPARLYENRSEGQGHWLEVLLEPDAVSIGFGSRADAAGPAC